MHDSTDVLCGLLLDVLCGAAALLIAKAVKLENRLVTIGKDVVIISLWAVFKIILYMIVYSGVIKNAFDTLQPAEATLAIVLIAAAGVTVLALHFFIGLSAISEGRGKRKQSSTYSKAATQIKPFSLTTMIYILCKYELLNRSVRSKE